MARVATRGESAVSVVAAAATAAEGVAAAKVAGAPDRPVGAGASVAAKAARRRRRRACRTGQLCVPKTKAKEPRERELSYTNKDA